jgi:endonuclease/exonuclease/phosphatase family metal-dependent hydrolase
MNASLKLVSINVEHERHTEAVLGLLKRESPDIAYFQEVSELDLARFKDVLQGIHTFYAPMTVWPDLGNIIGVGVVSKFPVSNHTIAYYDDEPKILTLLDRSKVKETVRQPLVSIDVEKDGQRMRFVSTHFTWTPNGQADDNQRKDLQKLFSLLEPLKEFVLCGDFNAPRGLEIFNTIAARYTDNIPQDYQTSLDGTLHRVGMEYFKKSGMDRYMVDGLFTTPGYRASNVRLEFGLSDHAAVIADIERV